MQKLLFLILIFLNFYLISSNLRYMSYQGIPEEDEKRQICKTITKCTTFLKNRGLYDILIELLQKGQKEAAQQVCEKKLPKDICNDAIYLLFHYIKQLN